MLNMRYLLSEHGSEKFTMQVKVCVCSIVCGKCCDDLRELSNDTMSTILEISGISIKNLCYERNFIRHTK